MFPLPSNPAFGFQSGVAAGIKSFACFFLQSNQGVVSINLGVHCTFLIISFSFVLSPCYLHIDASLKHACDVMSSMFSQMISLRCCSLCIDLGIPSQTTKLFFSQLLVWLSLLRSLLTSPRDSCLAYLVILSGLVIWGMIRASEGCSLT